jgi:hypothetical protein
MYQTLIDLVSRCQLAVAYIAYLISASDFQHLRFGQFRASVSRTAFHAFGMNARTVSFATSKQFRVGAGIVIISAPKPFGMQARGMVIAPAYGFRVGFRPVLAAPLQAFRVLTRAILVAYRAPALAFHVCQIISRSSEKQVSGITATAIIAPVADHHLSGVYIEGDEVRDAMRREQDILTVQIVKDRPVTATRNRTLPFPTSFGVTLFHLCFEPLNLSRLEGGNWFDIVRLSHSILLVRNVVVRAVCGVISTAAARFIGMIIPLSMKAEIV